MEEFLVKLLGHADLFAIFVSLTANVLVSIAGVLPSAFITLANLSFFGLYVGLLVSITGEAIGAIISFILYRKGIKKWRIKDYHHPVLIKLKDLEGYKAFWVILIFRILPFTPSGAVTLGSAFSKVSLWLFAIASTTGKIPSLLIEAGAIYGFMQVDLKWKIGLTLLVICFFAWRIGLHNTKKSH
ncbi:VTT domain-containing protein [Lysinibacillus fusiformis]|uniref:TVP38/TMEM64 family protein n=1 Tax=Ureibacillus chungkukjangi TaxID=1202712 RepID=UPI000D345D4D|nr:VTT domain-containing protein [Ureibacillus chungkukjangi]MCM3389321.1 VTT domain-containing protein [Ureibacillus chungkukjangi]MDI7743499.1 VTT domain-containing protein [Lysinibacillus fusiformis]